mgnify:CR=1 FL=1
MDAQIEKDLLAIVSECERFNQFIYRKQVTVPSDHKPLEAIITKPLSQAPPRIQCLLIRLQKYHSLLVMADGQENPSTVCNHQYSKFLSLDGEEYRWKGTFEQLKKYFDDNYPELVVSALLVAELSYLQRKIFKSNGKSRRSWSLLETLQICIFQNFLSRQP